MSRQLSLRKRKTLQDDPVRPALANHDVNRNRPFLPLGMSKNLTCFVLPNNASRTMVLDLAFSCALACTSEEAPLAHWKNLLLTYTNVMAPNIVKKIPKGMIQVKRLSTSTIQKLRNLIDEYDETGKPDEYKIPENAFDHLIIDDNMPHPRPGLARDKVTFCREGKPLYAHFSLVVFLAGKLINDMNRSAISTARPKALIEKYRIVNTEILTGSAKISNLGHDYLHKSYLKMSTFTAECFKEYSQYTASSTSVYHDIINVNVMLLRFAYMQHAALINKFITAYPWVGMMTSLQYSLAVYGNSIKALCALPAEIQPYAKLIYGDKLGIFPRKELGPLIACAVATEREINETMKNYYQDDTYSDVIEEFNLLRAKRSHQKEADLLENSKALVDLAGENSDDGGPDEEEEEEEEHESEGAAI